MKKHIILTLVAAVLSSAAVSAQNIKVGTVDMKKVFESYYKTKEAEAKINESRNGAKKDLEDRMDLAKKVLDEIKKIDEELQKPELSKESKDQKARLRTEKATDLQGMDKEIREFQQQREKQLQEQSVRMRAGIVDDINKIVAERVKAENYDIVLDKSGPSLNGVPVVLFARDTYDFTDAVVTALNKNKGKEPAPQTKPAADKPAGTEKPKKGTLP